MFSALVMDYGGVLSDPAERRLFALLADARERGLRTALLSNADRTPPGLPDVFDAIVLSGEVGVGKPDPRIYLHTARVLGVEPSACVLVDDLAGNVRGAAAVGMAGVHHQDVDTTLAELAILLTD